MARAPAPPRPIPPIREEINGPPKWLYITLLLIAIVIGSLLVVSLYEYFLQ